MESRAPVCSRPIGGSTLGMIGFSAFTRIEEAVDIGQRAAIEALGAAPVPPGLYAPEAAAGTWEAPDE